MNLLKTDARFSYILKSSATIFWILFFNLQLPQTRVNRIILSSYLSYTEQLYLFPRQNQASFPSFNDSLTHELIYMTKKNRKKKKCLSKSVMHYRPQEE